MPIFASPYARGFLPQGNHPLYPNPYFGVANQLMPTTMQEALSWGEYISMVQGPYREALNRVCSYCITEPEVVEGADDALIVDKELRTKYDTLFSDECLSIRKKIHAIDMDLLTYGNSFISVITKFTRYLVCQGKRSDGKHCGHQVPLEHVLKHTEAYDFNFDSFQFKMKCPICGSTGVFEPLDRYSKNPTDLRIHRWNIHEMEILYDPYYEERTFIWKIPSYYREAVKKGHPHILVNVPVEILKAIRNNENLKFRPGIVLHLTEEPLSGIRTQGWGLPRIVPNFCQNFFYQVMMQHTQTNALEGLAPMRVISPPQGGPEGYEPLAASNSTRFCDFVGGMIKQKRMDPSAWFTAPFPLQYQAIGGDATQFMNRDMLEWAFQSVMDCVGMPVELYRGTLSVQAAPSMLRLFETFWADLIACNNYALTFIVRRAADLLGWDTVSARFARITHAEDANRHLQTLQLSTSNMGVSKTTGLKTLGLNAHEEARRILEEQRDEAEMQAEMQETLETTKQLSDALGGGALNALAASQEQQQQAMGGQPGGPMGAPGQPAPQGPMPAGGGGGAMPPGNGMSPLLPGNDPLSQMVASMGSAPTDNMADMQAKAQTIANQLLMSGQTASGLRKLKSQDPDLHMLVKYIIEQTRSNAASQGQQMMMQEQFGGG